MTSWTRSRSLSLDKMDGKEGMKATEEATPPVITVPLGPDDKITSECGWNGTNWVTTIHRWDEATGKTFKVTMTDDTFHADFHSSQPCLRDFTDNFRKPVACKSIFLYNDAVRWFRGTDDKLVLEVNALTADPRYVSASLDPKRPPLRLPKATAVFADETFVDSLRTRIWRLIMISQLPEDDIDWKSTVQEFREPEYERHRRRHYWVSFGLADDDKKRPWAEFAITESPAPIICHRTPFASVDDPAQAPSGMAAPVVIPCDTKTNPVAPVESKLYVHPYLTGNPTFIGEHESEDFFRSLEGRRTYHR